MGRREEMLRKRDGENWKDSPEAQARRLGAAIKKEPASAAASAVRTTTVKAVRVGQKQRAWPKPPQRLIAHPGKEEVKTPIPVRTPHTLGGAAAHDPRASRPLAAAAAAASSAAPTEMKVSEFTLVRGQRTEGVSHNLLRFHEGSEVAVDQLVPPVTMRRVEDELDEQLEMAFAETGAGAEFGKAAKEAMRRKKYRRRERELDIRYHLQDKGGQHLLGEQQRDLRGKLFLIKRRSNGFEIFPVTNAWEFRRFKEHRGGAADGEIADKSLKESRPSGIAKFKKEGAFQKSEKEQLAEQLREQGVKFEPSDIQMHTTLNPTKKAKGKKPTVVATTHKVDLFDVDVDEEDSNEEIEFGPDDDSKLGGLAAKQSVNNFTGQVFALEDSDSSSSEEEVDVGGNSVVRRQRNDADAEDEEGYLNVDDAADDEEDKPDDWTAEEQGPAGASAAATADAPASEKDARKADSNDGQNAQSAKRRKVVATMSGAGAARPARNHAGLPPATRKEIRDDLEKYLARSSLKGMSLSTLLKKLKKKEYMKRHMEQVKDYLLKALPEIAEKKVIEGEDRFVLKVHARQLQRD